MKRIAHCQSGDHMNLVNGVSCVSKNLCITVSNKLHKGITKLQFKHGTVNEELDYAYENNTCVPGKVCGQYTVSQLIAIL